MDCPYIIYRYDHERWCNPEQLDDTEEKAPLVESLESLTNLEEPSESIDNHGLLFCPVFTLAKNGKTRVGVTGFVRPSFEKKWFLENLSPT